MRKVISFAFLTTLLTAFLGSPAWADNWAIVVNNQSMSISMIQYNCPGYLFRGYSIKVYGPFLAGSLGTSGGFLDVATTPDNKYALVSNYGQRVVYRIDISDPTNPIPAGSLNVSPFAPEDIDISPNGQFAVISGGAGGNQLLFINPSSFSSYSLYALTTPYGNANAVAIGKDNSTIIACDFNRSRIIFGRVNAALSGLVSESILSTDNYPINVSISPDGSTALVAITGGSVCVFRVTGPGTLATGVTPKITGFHDIPQSIAFDVDGSYAYVACNTPSGSPITFSMLRVNGPGNVSLGKERAGTLYAYGAGGTHYGVDVIVAPCSSLIIATNPSSSEDPRNRVSAILADSGRPDPLYSPGSLDDTQYDAKGIATFSSNVYPPSNVSLSRLTNNYIFYKEYVNRLTWQANPLNLAPIIRYRIYRKNQGAADSTYQQLTEVETSTLQYDDRGLKKNANYTYGISSINNRGLESSPVEVSNVAFAKR
jgi:DNA-binding beta-propeller fold protein YncE